MKLSLFIILVITFALVLGPVMMMRPNPAQKRRESLRTRARAEGVHFTMRNLPQQADAAEAPPATPVYFMAPKNNRERPAWLLLRTNYEHEFHFLGHWNWQGEGRPTQAELAVLTRLLPSMAGSIKAVGGGTGPAVYWDETGGEQVLDAVLHLLKELRDTEN